MNQRKISFSQGNFLFYTETYLLFLSQGTSFKLVQGYKKVKQLSSKGKKETLFKFFLILFALRSIPLL